MSVVDQIKFKSCNLFRQRLIYSLLSGRRIAISGIRPLEESPGVQDHEVKLIALIEKITNGTHVDINRTGSIVQVTPGAIYGGNVEFDCGTSRCISYYLEALVMLAPFCKIPMDVTLKGVTNAHDELSVDAIRATWLPVFNKFVLNDEKLNIKVKCRGFFPDGGGVVNFTSPIVKTLRPVVRENPGRVFKIRGLSYVCKVSPSIAHRMIEAARDLLREFVKDIYITVDQRKAAAGGNSPGFGLFLVAESTEGVFYHGEAMSLPKDTDKDQRIPEEVGVQAAMNLLDELFRGGCCDTSAQALASTFITLCEKDVSRFLFGPLSVYTIYTMRSLRTFFTQTFKIDEYWKLHPEITEADDNIGSRDKALITGVGIGYANLNKVLL